ncbi:imm11 family protein [Tropicibacter naphthalenivorans]|uniref:Immunity MXAN-0049 protein domain-containing protein n=1 Tax=Tropicibacter naphthalenivorans TaxID=441103 RepID=A0A0P1H233_9RHOB|nr:DUF1629 domain-containing protein [Tropicibacter naphthalenivorans]CUH81162.1 hypothetical protein TRN7648_03345 [Tropicibacter naphthalenivorans]SMC97470.1 hypothetical protein SAMN04488093_10849 [Tropicibacter naphthalenivorans]
MPYAFDIPSVFGRFNPDGEFRGYWPLVEEYYKKLVEDGKTEHAFFTTYKLELWKEYHKGTAVIPDEIFPRSYHLAKAYKSLGDIFDVGFGLCLSQEVKDILEGLEPGRHQIAPMDVISLTGEAVKGSYYLLRIRSILDAFDAENSDPNCFTKAKSGLMRINGTSKDCAAGIALDPKVIEGHHLWRGFFSAETGISGFDFYVSDSFHDAIAAAKLKTPKFMRLMAV